MSRGVLVGAVLLSGAQLLASTHGGGEVSWAAHTRCAFKAMAEAEQLRPVAGWQAYS